MLNFFRKLLPRCNKKYVVTNKRKKPDKSRFTQYQYDYILYAYSNFLMYNFNNPTQRLKTSHLVTSINSVMGTDKSRTAISKVWQGRVDRESLDVGDAYFTYKE